MESSTVIWIAIAVVVVLAVALLLWRSRGREAAQRAQAAEIRETAAEHDRRLREQRIVAHHQVRHRAGVERCCSGANESGRSEELVEAMGQRCLQKLASSGDGKLPPGNTISH